MKYGDIGGRLKRESNARARGRLRLRRRVMKEGVAETVNTMERQQNEGGKELEIRSLVIGLLASN
jgi:hypothetical protein